MKSVSANTLTAQVRDMKVGETLVLTERVALEDRRVRNVKDSLAKLRSTCNSTASRARKDHGSDFRVESQAVLNSQLDAILCICTITRIESDNDIDI